MELGAELRERVVEMAREMHRAFKRRATPAPRSMGGLPFVFAQRCLLTRAAQARKRFSLYEAAHEGGAMRHLRNTLYIFTEDAYATLDGENIVVKQSGQRNGAVCRCIR